MTVEHSAELNELAAALAKAQAKIKGAKKDAANPFYKTTYADLASTWDACREALTEHGLSVVQLPGYANGATPAVVTVTTMLLHSSGQWIKSTVAAPLSKQDAQGVGSAITYLRRYALAAVASVAPEDDDAQGAVEQPRKPKAKPEPQPMTERPAQLDKPEESAPWEALTRDTPCPHTKQGTPLSAMTKPQLLKLEIWLAEHGNADRSEEWMALVQAELKSAPVQAVS